ncbi:hypothetical protein [Chromobacterium sp. Rain0013]|uniref:hypothetical protein n=1 Tax=Chromobacterium sp. Rain0013 TaxID=2292447 RepID=UPI001888B5B1|nr:hypothetical protein [Chromobacterium sp. Rain0013]
MIVNNISTSSNFNFTKNNTWECPQAAPLITLPKKTEKKQLDPLTVLLILNALNKGYGLNFNQQLNSLLTNAITSAAEASSANFHAFSFPSTNTVSLLQKQLPSMQYSQGLSDKAAMAYTQVSSMSGAAIGNTAGLSVSV